MNEAERRSQALRSAMLKHTIKRYWYWLLLVSGYAAQSLYYRVRLAVWPVNRENLIAKRAARRDTIDANLAWEVLGDIQRIADHAGAKMFPISGTLLGIYRHGTILKHDVDIDVGIFDDDPAAAAFVNTLKASPLCVEYKAERLHRSYLRYNPWLPELADRVIFHKVTLKSSRHPDAGTVAVDVFVHFRSLGYVGHGIWNRLWLNTEMDLERRRVGGLDLLVPADIVKYLTENYGDFVTERINFENAVDCPNCVSIYGRSAIRYVLSLHRLYLKAGWHERQAILHDRYLDMKTQLWRGPSVAPEWKIRQVEFDGPAPGPGPGERGRNDQEKYSP